MRKTKKEKVVAALRRQKEFEKLKLTLRFSNGKKPQKAKEFELETNQLLPQTPLKQDKEIANLTNLSYLPRQIIKIGLITLGLILAQLILFLTIL